jgi:hypothetical protein
MNKIQGEVYPVIFDSEVTSFSDSQHEGLLVPIEIAGGSANGFRIMTNYMFRQSDVDISALVTPGTEYSLPRVRIEVDGVHIPAPGSGGTRSKFIDMLINTLSQREAEGEQPLATVQDIFDLMIPKVNI